MVMMMGINYIPVVTIQCGAFMCKHNMAGCCTCKPYPYLKHSAGVVSSYMCSSYNYEIDRYDTDELYL
jgi:hypothetical protein